MPKGYWIANVDVRDAEVYDKYRAANAKPFADFTPDVREGTSHPRIVVIEFASLADAVACYESDGYQAAKDIRSSVSDGNLVIVEGYDA